MNKKILALAIAAVTLMASSASAQNNRCNAPANNCKTEQCTAAPCDKKVCKKADCNYPDCTKNCCQKQRCNKKDRKQCRMFESLNLTQDQQSRIAAITPPREVIKAAVKNGTVKQGENMREYVRTVRADYLKSVKQVLTPDQYNKFLENFFVNAAPNHKGKTNKHGQHHKQGRRNK